MLSRQIISTEDGSTTIYLPEWNESYHSKHGAIQEAFHVFVEHGWHCFHEQSQISILEFGFGTGLNTLITLLSAWSVQQKTKYTALEKFPVKQEEYLQLNYAQALKKYGVFETQTENEIRQIYQEIMQAEWETWQEIQTDFQLKKIKTDFFEFEFPEATYDLVYFDAFGARVQPELWSEKLFEKIYFSMKENGVFTTYSSKGSVRRALISVGFHVEKKPGPPGKREMLIAIKKTQ